MAVRRISDLPNLYEYYPDAKLSDCLIETSYAKPTTPRRYQSFYAKLENVLNVLVANLPHATKSQFGVVRIGENINVVETDGSPDQGLISIPVAGTSTSGPFGVVKTGANIQNTGGVISVNTANGSTLGVVKAGSNVTITNGSVNVATGSDSALGVVKIQNGNGLSISNGVVSMAAQATTVTVTPIASFGDQIATINVNGTSYTLLNGVDIDALRQSMASAFIPNYSAKQVFYLPHGIVQDVSPLVKSEHKYFPTCRISCNCNAFMVLGDGYRLNNSSCGGVARKCTDASDVNNAAMLIDPWRPIEDDYYGGYFIPKGKYIYVKGPAWRNGDNSREVTICPLGLTTTDWSYTCDIYCNRGASFGWQYSADLGNTWISQTPPNEWFAGN